jgi:hypothetical protein
VTDTHSDTVTVDGVDAAVVVRRVDSSAHAIATITRGDVPVTGSQRVAAIALALDLLATAARHGVTRADLDGVTTLAGAAVDAILARDRAAHTSRHTDPGGRRRTMNTRPVRSCEVRRAAGTIDQQYLFTGDDGEAAGDGDARRDPR